MNRCRLPLFIIVLLACAALTPVASAVTLAESPAAAIDKECADEPVFGGVACIYQANQAAATTVVLVHGLNGQALTDWQHQIPVLARNYHVLAVDLPGFDAPDQGEGQEEVGEGEARYSPSDYARFLHYVIERYAHAQVVLVGHSMGGAITLRYMASYPQRVERLVLVGVAGVLHRMAYTRQLAKGWVESKTMSDSSLSSFADKMVNKLLSKAEPLTGPITEHMAEKLLRGELPDMEPGMAAALILMNEDLSDALRTITVPTLLLWGEDDRVAPLRTAQVLLSYLSAAQLAVIPGAAHTPMREQPERFNRLLTEYLDGHAGADPIGVATAPGGPEVGARTEICRNETDRVYEGRFAALTIISCSGITVTNATIDTLTIRSSRVDIENSTIISEGIALHVSGSDLMITASQLSGESAIYTAGSRLDLAAVRLTGRKYAVQGGRGSSLVFSVSTLDSPLAHRSIHEFVKVDKHHPL